MKKLIKLAKKIKDKELREKVIEFVKKPELTHKEFKKYPKMKIEKAKTLFTVGGPQGGGTVERDVLNHTIALTELCERTADVVEDRYEISINKDYLIAAAILHDLMKIFEWKAGEQGLEPTGVMLDHTMLAVAEYYKREFPEPVIHIIASHFGEGGPTPPGNFEALIFYHLDTMLSLTEHHLYATAMPSQQLPILFLDEKALKDLSGEGAEKKSK